MKGTCLRCGNDYIRLDKHLKTQTICEGKYLDVSREFMIEKYKEYYNNFILQKSNDTSNIDDLTCNHCGKSYKYKRSLTRHKKIHNEQNINTISNNTNSHNTNSNNTNSNNTNSNNTNSNNTTNINSNNVNNHYHVTINNFGDEDELSYATISKLFNGDIDNLLKDYVKEKHINIKQNRNVLITNPKNPGCKIYEDNSWKPAYKTSIVKKILNLTIQSLIKHIKLTNEKYQTNYSKDTPIENTNIFKKIIQIQNRLFEIEDKIKYENKTDKTEEMNILFELIAGKDKVLETIEEIENNI